MFVTSYQQSTRNFCPIYFCLYKTLSISMISLSFFQSNLSTNHYSPHPKDGEGTVFTGEGGTPVLSLVRSKVQGPTFCTGDTPVVSVVLPRGRGTPTHDRGDNGQDRRTQKGPRTRDQERDLGPETMEYPLPTSQDGGTPWLKHGYHPKTGGIPPIDPGRLSCYEFRSIFFLSGLKSKQIHLWTQISWAHICRRKLLVLKKHFCIIYRRNPATNKYLMHLLRLFVSIN